MPKGERIDFDTTRPPSPFLKEIHEVWRRELRRFIEREIMPHVEEWEEAGEIPLSLYKKASEFGLRRMGYPEQYGGISEGLDRFHGIVTSEEMARIGAGGIGASLMVHGIGLPPILAMGTDEMKQKIVPPVLAGDKHISLAITEPSGGSDVAQIKTRARR
ncbi:MAG TPA: acyl-CoA dehydrogenase family protein, partial [Rhizomicrobium sp.]